MKIQLTPEWTGAATPFRKTWQRIGNIDQFRWLSRADVLEQLRMARDELGVRYVRAAAMYSPELGVWDYDIADWRETGPKARRANWQIVDLTLEGLLELGLKPIYTTCFTPVGMTDDQVSQCWPDKNPVGMPRDLAHWQEFVAGGIRHHVERYGIEEVRSWYFECWNEPNLKSWFFGGTQEDFFQLWSATWRAVKSVDPALRIGGPSTARGEWIPEFLDYTAQAGTPPDYLISHLYNNDTEGAPLSPFDGPASHKAKNSAHFASGVMRGVRKALDQRGWTGEMHWNEWGRSYFMQELLRETALEPAFIVKTMAQVSQDADAFAYWCLSDIYNQGGYQSSEFQGNYGLLSLHGLRKQGWMAHQLLNRLGTSRLAVQGGTECVNAVATQDGNHAATLVYAYPEQFDAAPTRIEVRVAWPFGTPVLTRLGAEENNIIATWKGMGAPAYPTPAQLKELRASNSLKPAPQQAVTIEATPSGPVAVFEMECPGVALLEHA